MKGFSLSLCLAVLLCCSAGDVILSKTALRERAGGSAVGLESSGLLRQLLEGPHFPGLSVDGDVRVAAQETGHDHDHGHSDHEDSHEGGHEDEHNHGHEEEQEGSGWTVRDAWTGAMIACTVMVLTSLLGIALFYPFSKTRFACLYEVSMIALSSGLMLSESFLHLIPHAFEKALVTMGNSGFDDVHARMLWLGVAGLGGSVLVLLIEGVLHGVFHRDHEHNEKKVDTEREEPVPKDQNESTVQEVKETERVSSQEDTTETESRDEKPKKVSMGFANILTEVLCLFVDGSVIGIGFRSGLYTGVVIAIAVWLHEAPQELGDFVILKRAGFSTWAAVSINFGLSLLTFAGAATTIAVTSNGGGEAMMYLMMASAGAFFGLALFKLIPFIEQKLLHPPAFPLTLRILAPIFFVIGAVGVGLLTLLEMQAHDHSGHSHGGGEEGHAGHNH
uniref:Uncharacterized protein n=1 Tax=Chromera velia CCMP2878 TaxID=1169474 RepID=A0A0G4I6L1_9ALVE|eukprot:Cvel_11401.t1-p1 / transcript=Cvel_11401.t1 / gene=Cvel_11401 / organism=Chromera_velia_CCMP2878 / gene_product=Zinc transporter SLC39A7, putative / transcript_product=Zinc transporter SLC39A7, putative / location=Cvel_scaffold715:65402-67661(-) / protein_length=446 / sequence_SO=supercontig / SO=protein_coding / is_pseudo=false